MEGGADRRRRVPRRHGQRHAGGGSLISFPALLAVGYPAVPANVTNAVAVLPGYLSGSFAYRGELSGQGSRIAKLGLASALGALVGSVLLVFSPEDLFRRIVPFLILLSCGLLAAQPLLARASRAADTAHGGLSPWLLPSQFLAAVYGGYFSAGLGIMLLAILGLFLEEDMQRLNALKVAISLVIGLVTAAYFALFGPVIWGAAAIMAVTNLLGGQAGVFVARRMSASLLRTVVVVFGTAVAVYLML